MDDGAALSEQLENWTKKLPWPTDKRSLGCGALVAGRCLLRGRFLEPSSRRKFWVVQRYRKEFRVNVRGRAPKIPALFRTRRRRRRGGEKRGEETANNDMRLRRILFLGSI